MKSQGPRTLIIEDSPIFRKLLKEALLSRFPMMEVREAADGVDALNKFETFLPDLALIDIQLPGGNGLEVTKTLKSKNPDLRVIILTSYDLPEYREAAYQLQANYYLTKGSATKEEILALIESVLSQA